MADKKCKQCGAELAILTGKNNNNYVGCPNGCRSKGAKSGEQKDGKASGTPKGKQEENATRAGGSADPAAKPAAGKSSDGGSWWDKPII